MANGNYILKFVLTNFHGSQIKMVENENGDLEECVCIPLERNDLKKNKKNQVTAYAFMTKAIFSNAWGWTHYLKQKVNPNFLKKMGSLGISCAYLGNAKDSNYVVYSNEYKDRYVKVSDYE